MSTDPVPTGQGLLRRIPPLAVIDGAALFAFVLIGGDVHGAVQPASLLRTLLFFLIPWYATAAYFGLYRAPSWRAFLRTWAVAIPLGIILRAIWLERLFSRATVIFLIAALGVTLVLLIAARYLAGLAGVKSSS
jgi:hypothetical protein